MGLSPDAREEYEARQLERLVSAQAQAEVTSTRERKDSLSGSEGGSAGWLGRNMRKMRAKRDRSFDDRDRTVERESSFDYTLSTSPGSSDRLADMGADEGAGSGGSGRTRGGFDGSRSGGHSANVSALGSGGFALESERGGTLSVWPVDEDSAEIRYMPAANPGEIPRVKAATADKLVEWLTTPKYSGTLRDVVPARAASC
jgi:hypothetical protein